MEGYQSADFSQESNGEQQVNIKEYLQIIRKRIVLIITILVIIFSWKLVDLSSKVPIYTASSDVLIEKNRGARELEYQYIGYDPLFLPTQTKIITSENVAKRVVHNLKLHKRYRKYFVTDTPVKTSFLRNFTSKFLGGVKSIFPTKSNDTEDNTDIADEINTSDESLDLFGKQPSNTLQDIIIHRIQGGLSVTPLADTKIVTIEYRDKDPAIAQLVANAVVQAYKDVTLDIKLSSSNYTLQWMTEKAEEEKKKLEASESILTKYVRENDLVTVEDRLAVIPQKLSDISTRFTKAQAERKELEEVYHQIRKSAGNQAEIESIPKFANNSSLQAIRENIFKAKQNIQNLSKKYGYKHPVMIKAKNELATLNNEKKYEIKRIVGSTKNSYELAKSKEENLRSLLTETKGELLNVNEKFVQFSMMKREVDTNRVLFDALTSNIKKASVTEQAQSVNIWVVRKATTPVVPSYPNKKKELFKGIALGILLGLGLALSLEFLDNTIKSEKDLTKRFDLTILGTVEQIKGSKEEIETYIVRQPLSPIAESYRLIRSNLLLSSVDHPPKKILMTSMGPQEGKTSTTINIARILSQDKKKVVIIDCDLRKPRMHTLFGMDNKIGLSNYLAGNLEGNILKDIPGEDVKLIPSGLIPPNPAELLNSKRMNLLIDKMGKMFDFVLLDSPPIQRVTDSLSISQMVDGTIIVVRAGKTTNEMLSSGMKKLRDIQAPFLGFVLNGMSKVDAGSGYYAGYNTYYAKDDD